jgi:hypothetical protein
MDRAEMAVSSAFRPAWVVNVLYTESMLSAVRDDRCWSPTLVTWVQEDPTPTPIHAQQYMHIHQCPTSREDSACTHVVTLHVAHHRRRRTGATLWAAASLQDALFAHRGDEA